MAGGQSGERCPNCAAQLSSSQCQQCNWQRGAVPTAQIRSNSRARTDFVPEKRHKMILWCGLLACGAGLLAAFYGIAGASSAGAVAAGVILGPLMFASGVLTLKNTEFGRFWSGLAPKDKGWAAPGLVIGGGFGLILLPATLIAVAVMALFFNALGDVKRSL